MGSPMVTCDDRQGRCLGLDVKEPKGCARVRMRRVPAVRLQPFADDFSAQGATVRPVLSSPGAPAHVSRPGVHTVAVLPEDARSRAFIRFPPPRGSRAARRESVFRRPGADGRHVANR